MIMVTFGYISCCAAAPHVTKQYFKKIIYILWFKARLHHLSIISFNKRDLVKYVCIIL